MKKITKILSLVLVVAMLFSFACTASAERTYEPHKIAVMWGSLTASEIAMMDYLSNYVGPYFNCEFMYSEAIKDTGAAVSFVDQAHASGCEAILNFYSDGIESATVMAEDYGMYIVTNTNRLRESIQDMPCNIGIFGCSAASQAATFSELAAPILNDGKAHNIVIVSGGAAMGNQTHLELTVTLMQMVCDAYNTTIDGDLTELAKSPARTEVVCADGSKIMLYPGYAAADTYVSGFSSVLQSGEYDAVFCTYGVFAQLVQPIAEVEKAFNLDIKLVSVAGVGDATAAAFESGALDAAVLNPYAMYAGALFCVAYNALEGNAAAIQKGDGALMFNFLKWTAANNDEYKAISALDISSENYAVTTEDLASLLVSNNPEVNYDAINDFFNTLTAQVVMARYGM